MRRQKLGQRGAIVLCGAAFFETYRQKLHPRSNHFRPQFSLPLTFRLVHAFRDGSEPFPSRLDLLPFLAMVQVFEDRAKDEGVAANALNWRNSVVGVS